jgi:DNA helicase-2/ATP-dependent DNA helicase PcrA
MKNSLNDAQKNAAEAPKGPLLIVAGAGTGKTRTLVSRILYLIERGVPPERICAITFTNKAAKEMADRVIKQLGNSVISETGAKLPDYPITQLRVPKPYIGTFHSLGAIILRREFRAFGRDANFVIFDDHDSFDLVKKAVKKILPKQDAKTAAKKKSVPAFFAQRISEMKNLSPDAVALRRPTPEDEFIPAVFQEYEESLARNNAFDFDDLIAKPVELFSKNPAILRKHQTRFDAILVDEWQDINPKQHELVAMLAGGHRNLSVVGDDEQTIYSWRYADVKTFLNFEKNWPGAKIHFLEENYRSTGNIINAAAAVAQNNRFRAPKKLWTGNPDGEPITLFEAWGENDEALWMARQIENRKSKIENRTTAILYRTNAQSRAIEQALIRHDIPYRVFGGLKFYERREIKDAVAALRWAANPKDEVSRERLEKSISKKKFSAFREAMMAKNDLKPAAVLTTFLETFDYFDYLEQYFTNATEREENISELAGFVAGFQNLTELLEKISLLQAADDENNSKKAASDDDKKNHGHDDAHGSEVILMTIHMAKGLEFDTVFIAGAAEGLLPHIRSIDNEDSLEEERRLMYVAMTRAREKLLISFCGLPSRFLGEIPDMYLEQASDNGDKYNDAEADYDNP